MSGKKVKNNLIQIYYRIPIEAFIWISGLVVLALYNPGEDRHISLCLFNALGFKFCPGCGLGRSLALFMHGEFYRSFQIHPLGPFALAILVYRIYQQINNFFRNTFLKKAYHGKRIETFT